jgi:hypothetical protein
MPVPSPPSLATKEALDCVASSIFFLRQVLPLLTVVLTSRVPPPLPDTRAFTTALFPVPSFP